ncbi:MAG: T9SS type A sorting domain-containing protein [Bacteroidetes bacterium]|nr:T9SS type A sorting domain-containing protein [Bacteroidota bacterium]
MLLLGASSVFAQQTLTQSDFGAARDTALVYIRAGGITYYPPADENPATGWDFSMLDNRGTSTLNFYPPGNGQFDHLFPLSTYSVETAADLFLYVRVTADSVQQLGLAGNASSLIGFPIDFSAAYNPPLHMAELPVMQGQSTYQQTGFDARQAVSYLFVDSARVKRTIFRSTHFDAEGLLTLPNATEVPCLRVAVSDTTIDSIWVRQFGTWTLGADLLGVPGVMRDTMLTYSWWTNGRMSHILQIITAADSSVRSLQYLGYGGPLSRTQVPDYALRVYPNPTTGVFQVQGALPDLGTLSVLDTRGKVVRRFPAGKGQSYSLNGLAPGLYLVQVQDTRHKLVHLGRISLLPR